MSSCPPGARFVGVVGPNSAVIALDPSDRCTSTRTRHKIWFVVFSTVPKNAFLLGMYHMINRAPLRVWS